MRVSICWAALIVGLCASGVQGQSATGIATSEIAESGGSEGVPQPDYAPKIITPLQRRSVPYPGHGVTVLADMADTEAGVYLQEQIVPPRSLGAPPHVHRDEDEYFIVLDGSITFLNGEETIVAEPGTIAILPRGYWHGFWNPTDESTRLLLAVAPGNFGSFFDEVVVEIREANADTPEAIGGIIAEVAAARNVTVDMSRLPREAAALLSGEPTSN